MGLNEKANITTSRLTYEGQQFRGTLNIAFKFKPNSQIALQWPVEFEWPEAKSDSF